MTSVKQCQYPFSRPPMDSTIAGNASWISLQLGWLINIIACVAGVWKVRERKLWEFLTGQSLQVLKSWCTCESPEQGFCHYFTDGLYQAFTVLFHFTVVNVTEWNPMTKKISLSIHSRNFGNHVAIGPPICPLICPGSTASEFLCNGYDLIVWGKL